MGAVDSRLSGPNTVQLVRGAAAAGTGEPEGPLTCEHVLGLPSGPGEVRGKREKESWLPLQAVLPVAVAAIVVPGTTPGNGRPMRPAEDGLEGLACPPVALDVPLPVASGPDFPRLASPSAESGMNGRFLAARAGVGVGW